MYIKDLQYILQNLINDKKITLDMIGLALGVTKSTISNRSKSNSVLKPIEEKKIEKYFDISLSDFKEDVDIQSMQQIKQSKTLECDYYPDVFGSCGGGVFVLSEVKKRIKVPEECFIKPISKVKKYSVINAYGDSMLPTIKDKDRLLVQHFEYGEQIQDKAIYVFCYNEQIFIKRLYYNINEIIVKSDNSEFKTKFIQKEDINNLHIIGQIVGLMRDLR